MHIRENDDNDDLSLPPPSLFNLKTPLLNPIWIAESCLARLFSCCYRKSALLKKNAFGR